MTIHYDTIIIGAGLSAIAAGIRLAHYHKKVLILERHYLPGGLNSWYFHNGNYMDVGLHAITNYSEKEQRQSPLNKLFRQLRFKREDFDLCQQCHSCIEFPHISLRFTNHIQELEAEIEQKFPTQIDGFKKLINKINETDFLSLNAPHLSTRKIINNFITDPLLIEMLLEPVMYYGSAQADDIEFHQFCIMFRSLFLEGFWRPATGMKPFIETLLNRYKELGGEIRLHTGVKTLISNQNKITALKLTNDEILTADTFLSSAGAEETRRLCQHPHEPHHPHGKLSYVESVFILKKTPQELNFNNTISFFNKEEKFHYKSPDTFVDFRSGVLCAPNNFQIPQEKQPISSIRLTHLANFQKWNELLPEEYQQEKLKIIDQIKQNLSLTSPNFIENIIDVDLFTPKTIVRFTGHINGAIYGSPQKIRNGVTPYSNLFLCGTDQGFLGIIGSMLSGISITNQWLLK